MRRAALITLAALGVAMAAPFVVQHHRAELRRKAEIAERVRIEAEWQGRLSLARTLAGQVHLQSDEMHCELEEPQGSMSRSSGDVDADFLLRVAEQPLILFVVPGFEYQTTEGWQSFEHVRGRFADAAAVARAQPGGSAVCYVRWATQLGFGEDTGFLGDAVGAVRQLSQSDLLPAARRRIVVMGYSAGGNFAAYAVAHQVEQSPPSGTDLRLVTIGAPHRGTPVIDAALSAAQAATTIDTVAAYWNGDDDRQQAASVAMNGLDVYRSQRGVRQLSPGNGDVAALDALMERLGDRLHYLNIYSTGDDVVPADSAVWAGTQQVTLSGLRHLDLLTAPPGSALRRAFERSMAGAPLSAQDGGAVPGAGKGRAPFLISEGGALPRKAVSG